MSNGSFPEVTGSALSSVDKLTSVHKGFDFDWEAILEFNYLTLFEGAKQIGVVDIGGHAGRHSTVILDKLDASTVAVFEPLPTMFQHIKATIGDDPRVQLFNLALSNKDGEATFHVKVGSPEESGLRHRSFYHDGKSDNLEEIKVQVRTLDSVDLESKIDFVKIDTEGAEIDILNGGRNFLGRNRPIISVEFGIGAYDAYGHKPTSLYDFAMSQNYAVYDLLGNRVASRYEWEKIVDRFYWDYMLIPEEATLRFDGPLTKIRAIDIDEFRRV